MTTPCPRHPEPDVWVTGVECTCFIEPRRRILALVDEIIELFDSLPTPGREVVWEAVETKLHPGRPAGQGHDGQETAR